MRMIPGIDVSNNNGIINWSEVAADPNGIRFAWMKATEGRTFVDDYLEDNWYGCKSEGMWAGAYHYARPEVNEARSEADHFTKVMQPYLKPGDGICLDMEVAGNTDYSGWMQYWLEILESYLGFKPVAYTARSFIDSLNLASKPALGQNGLWLAQWPLPKLHSHNELINSNHNIPTAPEPWEFVAWWQYSDVGRIQGIQGDVDLDVFIGTEAQMKLYGMPETEIAPTPTPVPPVAGIDIEAIEEELQQIETSVAEIRRNLHS